MSPEIHALQVEPERAGGDARDVEQLVDQGAQAIHLAERAADLLGDLSVETSRLHGALQALERDGAEADCADLALVAHGNHLRQLVVEIDDLIFRRPDRPGDVGEAAQIDQRNPLQAETGEVVFDAGAELLRGTSRRRILDRTTKLPSWSRG